MLGRYSGDEICSKLVQELWYDKRSYFGKQNSTLESVVPLAMFVCQALILNKRPEVPANYLNFLKACLHQKLPSASFAKYLLVPNTCSVGTKSGWFMKWNSNVKTGLGWRRSLSASYLISISYPRKRKNIAVNLAQLDKRATSCFDMREKVSSN